jgi:hypothetical protein
MMVKNQMALKAKGKKKAKKPAKKRSNSASKYTSAP